MNETKGYEINCHLSKKNYRILCFICGVGDVTSLISLEKFKCRSKKMIKLKQINKRNLDKNNEKVFRKTV